MGCSPTASEGAVNTKNGAGDVSSSGKAGSGVVVGQISTILIVCGAVAFVVFFVIVGAVIKKRQTTLVVRTGDEDPPSSGLSSIFCWCENR